MIQEQDLIKYGFEKTQDEIPVWPFEKKLSEPDEDGGMLLLVVTVERNTGEFALVMPDGNKLFLQIENLEQLRVFESSIQSWEPNY